MLTPEAYLPLRAVGAAVPRQHRGCRRGRRRDIIRRSSTPPARRSGVRGAACDASGARPAARGRRSALAGQPDLPGPRRAALAGVIMTIRPGDQIALTGPSGAGKSSLLVVAAAVRRARPAAGSRWAASDLACVDAGGLAPPDRLGPAAAAPVRRHRGRQYRAGRAGRRREAIARAARDGRGGRLHRGAARRYDTPSESAGCGCLPGQRQRDRAGSCVPAGRAAAAARRAHRAISIRSSPADLAAGRTYPGTPTAVGHRR